MVLFSPHDYLSKAITLIEKRSIRTSKVDWKSVRAKCFEMIDGAKSTESTYGAINYVLEQLGDNHSFLESRSGAATRDYSKKLQLRSHKRVRSPSIIESSGKKVAFICVGSLSARSGLKGAITFSTSIQHEIAEALQQTPVGWIVDLRGNTGGNLWPMLVGAGPIIGAGILGFFEYPNLKIPWFYENGESGVFNKLGKCVNFRIDHAIPDLKPTPVVVLINGTTASSGEALAISFIGRPDTCLIGSRSRGLATNNERIKLSDGATLFLTTSGESDRNQISYEFGIAPDIVVEQVGMSLGGKNDPVIGAALMWLNVKV